MHFGSQRDAERLTEGEPKGRLKGRRALVKRREQNVIDLTVNLTSGLPWTLALDN
jgi:hypothetical protein